MNRQLVEASLRFERQVPHWHEEIVIDPQTSGGLLVAVAENVAAEVLAALHAAGVEQACKIGRVEEFNREAHLKFV